MRLLVVIYLFIFTGKLIAAAEPDLIKKEAIKGDVIVFVNGKKTTYHVLRNKHGWQGVASAVQLAHSKSILEGQDSLLVISQLKPLSFRCSHIINGEVVLKVTGKLKKIRLTELFKAFGQELDAKKKKIENNIEIRNTQP